MKKLKVGDWAVITTLDSKSEGSMNGEVGHVFQIESISSGGFYRATSETWGIGSCWPLDCIRLAEPSEIPGYVPEPTISFDL